MAVTDSIEKARQMPRFLSCIVIWTKCFGRIDSRQALQKPRWPIPLLKQGQQTRIEYLLQPISDLIVTHGDRSKWPFV